MSSDTVNPALVRALARYLREHPMASDTPQGIARWWLESDAAVREVALLQALEWMEKRNLVERVAAPDGRVRFRRHGIGDTEPWQERLHQALDTLPDRASDC